MILHFPKVFCDPHLPDWKPQERREPAPVTELASIREARRKLMQETAWGRNHPEPPEAA